MYNLTTTGSQFGGLDLPKSFVSDQIPKTYTLNPEPLSLLRELIGLWVDGFRTEGFGFVPAFWVY